MLREKALLEGLNGAGVAGAHRLDLAAGTGRLAEAVARPQRFLFHHGYRAARDDALGSVRQTAETHSVIAGFSDCRFSLGDRSVDAVVAAQVRKCGRPQTPPHSPAQLLY